MAGTPKIKDFRPFSGDLLPEPSGAVFAGYDRKGRPTWLVVNDTSPETALFLVRQDGKKLKAKKLKLPPGSPSLDDLEGITKIGDAYYAMGSYAGDKRSQKLVKIELADDFSVRKITAAPRSVELKTAIQSLLQEQYPGKFRGRDFKNGAFNIEGFSATEKGTLLIGLRGPLLQQGGKQKAIVIELKNPDAAFSPNPARKLDLSVYQLLDIQRAGVRALSGQVPGWGGGILAIAGKTVSHVGSDLSSRMQGWRDGTLVIVGKTVGDGVREEFPAGKGKTAKFLLYFVDAARNLCRRIARFERRLGSVKDQPEAGAFGFDKDGKRVFFITSDSGDADPSDPRQGEGVIIPLKKVHSWLRRAGITPAPGD